jgi:hypothetical protein
MLFSNIDFDERLVVEFPSRQTSNFQGRVITLSIADKQRFNCWPFCHLSSFPFAIVVRQQRLPTRHS